MAQIIKHRRGTAAQLKTVTLAKAELGVSTGSVAGVTTPILHVGDGANAAGFVVGRLHQGGTVPTLNSGTIGSSLNDILFHDSTTYKLYKLHTSGNENLDLTGNIANRTVAGTLTTTGNLNIQATISASGDVTASNIYASGNVHADGNITFLGGSSGTITLGDSAGDNVVFGADIQSSMIPDASDTYNLGSTGQRWNNVWVSGSITANGGPHSLVSATTIDIDAEGALTIDGGSITIGGDADVAVDFDAAAFDLDASGALTIDSATSISIGTAADKPIDIDSTTLDIDASGALSIDSTTSIDIGKAADVPFDIDTSTLDIDSSGAVTIDTSAGGVSIDAAAASNFSTAAGILTLSGVGGISIAGSDQEIDITTTGGTDINTATLDIDASGAITIDAGAASNFTTSAGNLVLGSAAAITLDGTYVDVESIRFTGDNVGISGDTDLLVLSSGLVTLNGSLKINDDANIGIDADSDLLTLSTGKLTVAGETETTTLDVNGASTFAENITLDKASAQTITHTGGSGNLTISSTNGDVVIENTTFNGNNLTVPGNLTVNGTETIVNSTTLEIGDRVVVLNTAGASGDGGIQVLDKVGTAHTGSLLWNPTGDYWYSGISGSTHYRVPQQTTAGNLTNDMVLIADGNGRIKQPSTGGTADFGDADLTSVDMIQGVDSGTHIDLGTTNLIETKGNVIPNTTDADDLGSDAKRFSNLYLESDADIDGTLNIQGVVTAQALINATNGITVTNAAATISSDLILDYSTSATHRLMFQNGTNDSIDFLPSPSSTNTNGDTSGEYARWTGNAFEMTQTIDGGSF